MKIVKPSKQNKNVLSHLSLGVMVLFGGVFTATLLPTKLYAQVSQSEVNSIQDIDTSGNSKTATINIKLQKSLDGLPNSSILNNPTKLIIDLPNTKNVTKANFSYNHAILKDINITTIENRSRLVLNLNKQVKHKLEINGNLLTIKLDNIEDTAVPTSTLSNFVGKEVPSGMSAIGIKDIDFQKTEDGAGKIILSLANKNVLVDVKQLGASLVADFINTKAPDNIKRNYDVNDFSTPVKTMRLTTLSNGTRLAIEPKGAWRYSSYQANEQFVIEVHPIKTDSKVAQQTKYKGKKLSLNFQDIDVRSLMQVFADFTGLNIVVNDNVQGNLTLRLKDVPWDQAFDLVLQTKNLGSKSNGSIILVAPKDEMMAKEKLELETKAQIADLEPLKTQTIQLNYHKAETVAKSLIGDGTQQNNNGRNNSIVSKRGSIIFDIRTNQLFITDTPAKLEEITQMVQKIDVPVRQVVIEARIVEANDSFGRNLGVKLGFMDGRVGQSAGLGLGNNRIGVAGNQTGSYEVFDAIKKDGVNTAKYDMANTNFFSLPATGINGFAPATVGFSILSKGAQSILSLELSALEADGKGKIVSSPRILTIDKQKAIIEQGTELPYESATSSGATSVQFKKANLKLEVTPQITPEGKIFLDVDINKDSPSAITNGSAGLAIDTKHVQTQVLVDNGGTVMIGGIFQESERKNVTKVPFFGDLPVLGNLFKTTSNSKERTEILIFLTPKVIEVDTTLKQ